MRLPRPWTLFQALCLVAPLAVQAAPNPDPSPAPDPLLVPQPVPEPEAKDMVVPAVPALMGWIGSIGGLLGIISFTETYITKIINAINKEVKKAEEKKEKAPWAVAVAVGLDGSGLKGAQGDFPQVCLWNAHGQLLGFNKQNLKLYTKHKGKGEFEASQERPEGMPEILNGGFQTVAIPSAPGQEGLRGNQAAYVTMIKRSFDAICVASVHVQWPDGTNWAFDGTWGRAANIIPEDGIPEGDRLNEGMRKNEVDQYRVPLGVKFHLPSYKVPNYGDRLDDFSLDDFVLNPARQLWFYNSLRKRVRRGNPVLPLMHPHEDVAQHNPRLIWEDEFEQDIPVDCLTDWYYDEWDKFINPADGDRCKWAPSLPEILNDRIYLPCHPWKRNAEDDPEAAFATPPLQERHARTLVNDKNHRGGSGARELCESPHSVGPSYANHLERVFCHMEDRTLWPFCDSAAGVTHGCFDTESEVLVVENAPLAKRTVYWDAIEDWDSGERSKRAA
ncbi:nkyrin repeat protein [Diaporthe amygdali]|uniref:nkyrin repeat protein n=1 Tax=Phomopsis amygdali TaxID=1214568 RepID=UPI0022FF2E2A|nr:nkyrin repeat protein [Diaporthe amygdali]KAJ0103942.1 nkyrin repeat protein [Diaporthe amygdali]